MPVYFKNPGEADLRGLTTFGLHVKENEKSIGHFGTGFKYGTGIVMRLGGKISVYIGLQRYEFFTRDEVVRGKEFKMVHIRHPDGSDHPVGMTSEVGKNWLPWMAYREFRCNAQDEGGFTTSVRQQPEEGHTLIIVDCDDIQLAHQNRDKYFINSTPVLELQELECHPLVSSEDHLIFYKGVTVGEFSRPPMFRYNFTEHLMLTEDRTLSSTYYTDSALRRAWANCNDADALRKVLAPPLDSLEAYIDFSNIAYASEVFLDTATEVIKKKPRNYNITLRKALSRLRNLDPYEWVDPSVVEAKMLMKAEAVCMSLGMIPSNFEIRIVANLGVGVLGAVHGNNIYLAKTVFAMGTKMVAGTLFEELVHATFGHSDESREMQNYLIDKLMSVVEELGGEPM